MHTFQTPPRGPCARFIGSLEQIVFSMKVLATRSNMNNAESAVGCCGYVTVNSNLAALDVNMSELGRHLCQIARGLGGRAEDIQQGRAEKWVSYNRSLRLIE